MLSWSVNQKMVQQLQVVMVFLTEAILSLNHSRQKVGGKGRKKAHLIIFQLAANS